MIRFILISFSFLAVFSLSAQKKDHIVKVSVDQSLGIKTFFFDEIIDNRIVKSNIGFAQKGLNNVKVKAIFPDEFTAYLGRIIENMSGTPQGEPLVLIVHEFNISEQTKAMSETGIFRYQFEVARKKEGQLYSVWFSEGLVESNGMDVTKHQPARIKRGLRAALIEFHKSKWQENQGELIELNSNLSYDYRKAVKPGLYSSFNQLCKGEPFMESGFILKYSGRKYPNYFVEDENDKKIRKRILFVSDGANLYMYAGTYRYRRHFTKAMVNGQYIYFEDRLSDPMAGVIFGLIGTMATNTVRSIILDTTTGLVSVLDDLGMKSFLADHPAVAKLYYKSKKGPMEKQAAVRKVNEHYMLE